MELEGGQNIPQAQAGSFDTSFPIMSSETTTKHCGLLVKYFHNTELNVQASAKTSLFWLDEVSKLQVGAYKKQMEDKFPHGR